MQTCELNTILEFSITAWNVIVVVGRAAVALHERGGPARRRLCERRRSEGREAGAPLLSMSLTDSISCSLPRLPLIPRLHPVTKKNSRENQL